MLIKHTFASKSQTLRMRYLFQSTGRPISHRNGWSFRVYMIPLRDFVPEWNSRAGVNSRRGDSHRQNIMWWYLVNKYRAMRGNRSELAPGRKSPWCRVNTPWVTHTLTQSWLLPSSRSVESLLKICYNIGFKAKLSSFSYPCTSCRLMSK